MLARYIQFVDAAPKAAFLWARNRGIARANSAAWEWTNDLVQAELLAAAANACADELKAQMVAASETTFVLVPLLDSHQRADYVMGLAGADLADLPSLLHELHENLRHFSQTIHLLPQAVLTARPNGSFDYASRRWYQIVGEPLENGDVAGMLKKAAGPQAPRLERKWVEGLSGGELFTFEVLLETVRGARCFELRAAPSYEGAHLRKWIVTLDDVHERVEAQRQLARFRGRLTALADIGAVVLDRSLTDEELIDRTLQSAAGALAATWSVIMSVGGKRIARTYPPTAQMAAEFIESLPADGRYHLRLPLEFSDPGDHHISVVRSPNGEAFDDIDIDFVREVTRRIASALQNVNAYRRESRIARVLQTAMLPVSLPRAPGISFDVSYVTPEVETLIGGDWYDAFELHDGRLAFSIGDVAGHGLDSAVIMGHVREIVRALALRGAAPGDVLAETNGVVIAGGYGLITSVVGYLDPATLLVEYACAGHAPPLQVEPNGNVESLELGDVILGAVPRARFRTQSLRLHPGGALVLYTDGLVEYAHDSISGETKLRTVLSQWARDGFQTKAAQLSERVLSGVTANDDVAMLIVRSHRTESPPPAYASERRTPASRAADSRS